MELETILKYLLPEEFIEYFELVAVTDEESKGLILHLDERKLLPHEHFDKDLVSNGFDEPITIQDFPLRQKRVYLKVRRRKWKDKATGKIYSKNWELTATGTSYSKEFAAFLKVFLR